MLSRAFVVSGTPRRLYGETVGCEMVQERLIEEQLRREFG